MVNIIFHCRAFVVIKRRDAANPKELSVEMDDVVEVS